MPDVTWIPVSEPACAIDGALHFVYASKDDPDFPDFVTLAFAVFDEPQEHIIGWDSPFTQRRIKCVTHYMPFIVAYPEPPEEA
jgi:hypothetical protein